MLFAAEHGAGLLARLRARQVDAAVRAAHEITVVLGLLSYVLPGAWVAKRASHQPYGERDEQDKQQKAAHRAIIYRREKTGGSWSG